MSRETIAPRTRSLAIEGILTDGTVVREARNVTPRALWAAEARLRKRYPYLTGPGRPSLRYCDYYYRRQRIVAVYVPDGWDGAGERIVSDSRAEFEGLLIQHLGITTLQVDTEPAREEI